MTSRLNSCQKYLLGVFCFIIGRSTAEDKCYVINTHCNSTLQAQQELVAARIVAEKSFPEYLRARTIQTHFLAVAFPVIAVIAGVAILKLTELAKHFWSICKLRRCRVRDISQKINWYFTRPPPTNPIALLSYLPLCTLMIEFCVNISLAVFAGAIAASVAGFVALIIITVAGVTYILIPAMYVL